MLGLGGLALLGYTPWVAAVVVLLLVIVVASYRQTCEAYPNGGGAYAVSRANLGQNASLTAASALLIDYVLTVAVSVVAGVAAITSAAPSLGAVCGRALARLRCPALGRQPARRQGVGPCVRASRPTASSLCVFAMLVVGFAQDYLRRRDHRRERGLRAPPCHRDRRLRARLPAVLSAFASGCTALTGVEAVSNGVPAFEEPKSRNAAATLVIMGFLSISMFAGITALAIASNVHMAENPANLIGLPAGAEQRTAISQIGIAAFGETFPFYLLQGFTAAILILAANTAFNGFPVLSSLLGRDNYLPHQLANRGDRLVFSNGIVLLALVAGLLIVAFNAEVSRLIQLYILGVFLSFTLSQAGMVRHWSRAMRERGRGGAPLGCAASGSSTGSARSRPRRVRDRVGDQVLARRVDRRGRRTGPVSRDEGRLPPLHGSASSWRRRRPA